MRRVSIVDSGPFQQRLLLEDRIVAFSKAPLDPKAVTLPDETLPLLLCRAALEAIQNTLGYDPTATGRNYRISSPSAVRLMAREGQRNVLSPKLLCQVREYAFFTTVILHSLPFAITSRLAGITDGFEL